MESQEFGRVRRQVLNCCQKNQLYTKWDKGEAGQKLHYDFIFELSEEATDRNTLEVPTCIEPTGFILVKLPSPQSMGKYWFDNYEKNIERYKDVTEELIGISDPDYLIGVSDGYVSHLMWCIWD